MGFNLVSLAITLRTDNPVRLKNSLPLLGKDYASACRSLSCRWLERSCATCSSQEVCGWNLLFGQKLTSDPAALKRHQKPPLPFVFSFPMLDLISDADKEIVCGLVVIGPAISHLEMLLNGFAELLLCGSSQLTAEIVNIACRDYQGSVQSSALAAGLVRSGKLTPDNLLIASTEGLLESRTWNNSDLKLRLLSPLRLIEDNRQINRFEFSRFARSVMRRVSSLAYYYGESEIACDFKELTQQVEDVICTDDHFCYSNNNNKKISGIIGFGTFLGDFSQLMPLLVIGSYVHTGKGSSFGMGAFEVLFDDNYVNI